MNHMKNDAETSLISLLTSIVKMPISSMNKLLPEVFRTQLRLIHRPSAPLVKDQLRSQPWLYPQFHAHDAKKIKKPDEFEHELQDPPKTIDPSVLNRVQGSMLGMALGDALGAPVEFRSPEYLAANPVKDLQAGGTWGLAKGQFTDDTSMALCLATSLIARHDFVPYDQLVRYKWWYKTGYLSSTGKCFDSGMATSAALSAFQRRQNVFAKSHQIPAEEVDFLSDEKLLKKFDVFCSEDEAAGNGALMRLAPVPLFFYQNPKIAVEYSGRSGEITHGDQRAYDACRYYGALIIAALHGESKTNLLSEEFYQNHKEWFGGKRLHEEIVGITQGTFKSDAGIRAEGYVVSTLRAALWAFWTDDDSFEKGALTAVNLGDDTDTTAAIYGQLAGAYYTDQKLPEKWLKDLYAKNFIQCLSKWIVYEGSEWHSKNK